MPEYLELACPNPACPDREVEGESVLRETWSARWYPPAHSHGLSRPGVVHSAFAHCPGCGTEGIDAEDEKSLDEEEEALGRRCEACGIVTANPDGGCPHCGEAFPEQAPPTETETQ